MMKKVINKMDKNKKLTDNKVLENEILKLT